MKKEKDEDEKKIYKFEKCERKKNEKQNEITEERKTE